MQTLLRILLISIFLIFYCASLQAADILTASHAQLDFTAQGDKSKFLTIRNAGNNIAYVTIDITRLEQPGTRKAKVIRNKNPKKLGLLVTPTKLILKPQKSKKIRLINLTNGNDHDVFFRISASGVKPPQKLEERKTGIGLEVNAGIGTATLVIVRPESLKPKLSVKQIGTKLLFTNTGNTTIEIRDISQCIAKKECKTMGAILLYPGTERTRVSLYKNTTSVLNYTQFYSGIQKKVSFDVQ